MQVAMSYHRRQTLGSQKLSEVLCFTSSSNYRSLWSCSACAVHVALSVLPHRAVVHLSQALNPSADGTFDNSKGRSSGTSVGSTLFQAMRRILSPYPASPVLGVRLGSESDISRLLVRGLLLYAVEQNHTPVLFPEPSKQGRGAFERAGIAAPPDQYQCLINSP